MASERPSRRGRRTTPPAAEGIASTVLDVPGIERSQRTFLIGMYAADTFPMLWDMSPTLGSSAASDCLLYVVATMQENGALGLDGKTWEKADNPQTVASFFTWAKHQAAKGTKFKLDVR